MPESPLTPEEKLLRIIESGPGKVPNAVPTARKAEGLKFSLKTAHIRYGDKFKQLLNLKAVNVILFCLGAGFTLFIIVDFLVGLPRMANIMRLEMAAKSEGISDVKIERLKPLSYYLQEISTANFFGLPVPKPPEEGPKEEPLPQELTKLVESLNLVGIIWSNPPQAIIEDKKNGRNYLVNRGSKVEIARVKDILKDKVILSYDRQEVELK